MQHKQFSVRTRQCQKWQTKTLGFGCGLGQRCSVSVWHSARVTVKNVWNHYVSKSSHHYSWIFHRSSFITDRDWVWFLIFTYPHPRAAKRPAGSDRRSNRLQKPFYSWFNSSDVFFTLPDMYALTDRKTARAFDQTYTTCLSEDEFMNACVLSVRLELISFLCEMVLCSKGLKRWVVCCCYCVCVCRGFVPDFCGEGWTRKGSFWISRLFHK